MSKFLPWIACLFITFLTPALYTDLHAQATIQSVWAPPGANYQTGQELDFTVNYTAGSTITVAGGTPYIVVNVGGSTEKAVYTGNNNSGDPTGLTFAYIVQAGDFSATGVTLGSSIVLNGATMQDQNGVNVDLTLNGVTPSNVAPNVAQVNAKAPQVATLPASGVTDVSAVLNGNVVPGSSPVGTGFVYSTDPTLATGTTTIVVSNLPASTSGSSFNTTITGLQPGTTYYYVAGAQEVDNGQNFAGAISSFTTGVDVVSAWGPPGGDYVTGQTLTFTINYPTGSTMTVTGSPYINVTVGGVTERALYTGNTNTGDPTGLTFAYTVQAGDFSATGVVLGSSIILNGGSIVNQNGATAGLTLNGVTPSNVAPNITQINVVNPVVTTLGVTNGTDVSATINGSVIPGSSSVTTGFVYGTDPTLSTGTTILPGSNVPAGTTAVPFSANLSGLTPLTTYYYLAGAQETLNGQNYLGSIQHFTTGPSIISVWGPAGDDYLTGEQLNFTVNYTAGSILTVTGTPYIEVNVGGTTERAYYNGHNNVGDPAGLTFTYTVLAGDFSATGVILGSTIVLNGGTIVDANGNSAGLTLNGVTPSNVAPNVAQVNVVQPIVQTLPATAVVAQSATINGSVTPGSSSVITGFVYGTDPTLTTGTTVVTGATIAAGTSSVPFSANLTGLTPNTTYYFEAGAQETFNGQNFPGAILSFTTAALPTFAGGGAQTLSVCENAPATSTDALLSTNYPLTGTNLTYTIISGPANGALSGYPASATSTSGAFNPTGTTYTPASGYSGPDQFTIQVSDGTNTATTTITVTVKPLPTVQPIAGASSVCPSASTPLTDATTGGVWSVSDATIATIDAASGSLTGVAPGTVTVQYTSTANGCSDSVTDVVTVTAPPAQPGAFTAGPATVTYGQTGVAYTVPNDPTVTLYTWTYSGSNVTINGTGNSVTLDFPTTATAGTLSVVAQGVCGTNSAPQQIAINLVAPTITISPSLAPATVGVAYNDALSTTGGTSPYTYTYTGTLPPGITLDNGVLSGTPTGGGTFNFTITATDASNGAGPFTGTQSYTLVVAAPTITISPALAPATVGVAYNDALSTTGGTSPYTYTYTGTLPPGITLNTGALSGTPTGGGTFNFTITATDASANAGPYTGTQSYTLVVNQPTIVVTPSTLAPAAVGVSYSATLGASGGTSPYTYTYTGTLPPGITLNNGVLSGTPTGGGTFNFTITATDASANAGPYTGTQSYTLVVNQPTIVVTPSTLAPATVGVSYTATLGASGGTSPYTYTYTGSLPPGVTLSTDGTLSGTPTGGGSFNFTITATDASANAGPYTGTQSYTLVVNQPTIVVTPSTLAPATVGVSYSATLGASGGTAPYSNYVVSAGSLPPGVTLSTDGTLSGTPTGGGSFNFTVTVTDASANAGPYTGSQSYTLVVNAPAITITPALLPAGTVGVAYSQTMSASGGTAPYGNYTLSGSYPPGLSITPSGVLSGTPTEGGTFNFSISLTDASSGNGPYSASQAYTLVVNAPTITLTPAGLPDGVYGQPYATVTFGASGGTAPYSNYTVSSGSLPTGLSLSSAGVLSGTPNASGDFTFTVSVTDASGNPYTANATYTLHVGQATLTITADNQSKTYGQPNPPLTVSYSGFIGSDNAASLTVPPSVTTSASATSGVNTYTIQVSGAQDPNYVINYVNGTLTVNPATLLVTAVDTSRYYNTPNPTLKYYFTGFVNGDDSTVLTSQPSISTTAVLSSAPGQYPITLSGGNAANYTLSYQDGVLVVKASMGNTITFGALPVKTYGDPDFAISATASSNLPVRFESADNTIATVTQDASGNWMVHIVAAGQVTIKAFQDGNADYDAAVEVDQVLTINKADQVIAFTAPANTAETGNAPLTLEASASSGLPVTFTASDPTIAAVSGNSVLFTGTGTVTITATQPGNEDYNAATPVSYTITVYNGGAFNQGIAVFPNPAHGTLYIHFSSDYLITKYCMFGMNGQIVRGEDNVTNNANVIPINVASLAPGYYLLRVVCIRNTSLVYPVFKVLIQ